MAEKKPEHKMIESPRMDAGFGFRDEKQEEVKQDAKQEDGNGSSGEGSEG